MDEITTIELDNQPIELCKLLKVANMVGGGGEAKIVISAGYVLVNGEPEFQKRKKIYHQDVIEFNGEVIEVYCTVPIESKVKTKNKATKENQHSPAPAQKTKTTNTPRSKSNGGRKRINF